MTYLEEIKIRFANDFFATKAAKINIISAEPVDEKNIYDCEATNVNCEMIIEDLHRNAAGGVMGGAIFTLADYAFAICANALNKSFVTVSVSSTINFIGVCKGTKLIAKPECVKTGKNLCFYEIKIFDDLDNLISSVLMTGIKKGLSKN
ncbi:MAG: PaaI family thioesterase [Spirochaetaceae bacterium]|nr:PaaI family thioesterase [Spirochaetaceae bacterium]MBQ7905242.1 PaaI family thioesterase [Spirochaetaceae bacterium]